MGKWPKPAEGTWTEHYPELGTGPISFRDSVSPEFYELEREAIFKRAWLNVAPRRGGAPRRQLPHQGDRRGRTSMIVVRGQDGQIRAFYNICRTAATGSCGTTTREEVRRHAASSPASTTGGATASTGDHLRAAGG